MTKQNEALKLALDALKTTGINDGLQGPTQFYDESAVEAAIQACQKALAQTANKGLFIDLIAQHEGLADELSLIDAQFAYNQVMQGEKPDQMDALRAAIATYKPTPAVQPLTDEQIDKMFEDAEIGIYLNDNQKKRHMELYYFGVRDSEAAHGIGSKT